MVSPAVAFYFPTLGGPCRLQAPGEPHQPPKNDGLSYALRPPTSLPSSLMFQRLKLPMQAVRKASAARRGGCCLLCASHIFARLRHFCQSSSCGDLILVAFVSFPAIYSYLICARQVSLSNARSYGA